VISLDIANFTFVHPLQGLKKLQMADLIVHAWQRSFQTNKIQYKMALYIFCAKNKCNFLVMHFLKIAFSARMCKYNTWMVL